MAADAEAAAPEGPPELAALERELTQQVPSLLEAMNRASAEVNTLESRLGEAQDRYKKLLEQWSRLYEDLRLQHGANIERVKPYFDAKQVLNAASRRVHTVVREFSAAASLHTQAKVELRSIEEDLAYGAQKVALDRDQQDGLSRATVRVLKCQQERDRREQEYARALREYQEAKEASQAWHMQIGDSVINRTLPSFRQLANHQSTLAEEQARINALTERARHAKAAYHTSMRELDRINVAVHAARRKHRESAGEAEEAQRRAAPPQPSAEGAAPPQRGGAPEALSPPAETPCEAPLEEATPLAASLDEAPLAASSEVAAVEAAPVQKARSQEAPSPPQEAPPQEAPAREMWQQEALEEAAAATPEALCQQTPPQEAPPQDAPPQEAPPQDAPPQEATPQDAVDAAEATPEAPSAPAPRTTAPPVEAAPVSTAPEAVAPEEVAPAPPTKSLQDGAKMLLEPAAAAETGRAAEPRAAPECEPEAEPLGASP